MERNKLLIIAVLLFLVLLIMTGCRKRGKNSSVPSANVIEKQPTSENESPGIADVTGDDSADDQEIFQTVPPFEGIMVLLKDSPTGITYKTEEVGTSTYGSPVESLTPYAGYRPEKTHIVVIKTEESNTDTLFTAHRMELRDGWLEHESYYTGREESGYEGITFIGKYRESGMHLNFFTDSTLVWKDIVMLAEVHMLVGFLRKVEDESSFMHAGKINESDVFARMYPKNDSETLEPLGVGETMDFLFKYAPSPESSNGNWYGYKTKKGPIGWIYEKYIVFS